MMTIRKISKIGIVCLFFLSIILLLIPVPATFAGGISLYARHDDLIGSKPMYFALTDNGISDERFLYV